LEEFFEQHVDQTLAPKTVERYHEQAAYLDLGLLAMPLADITALRLNREWKRLLICGGHHRRSKAPRPLSKKTVRNIAGVLYRNDLDLIFAEPDGTPLKPDSISATVSSLFRRLKIPKPKGAALHLLRHSHGSHMLANGVPLPVVSRRLGHASIRTTQTFTPM
jgi:integrase